MTSCEADKDMLGADVWNRKFAFSSGRDWAFSSGVVFCGLPRAMPGCRMLFQTLRVR